MLAAKQLSIPTGAADPFSEEFFVLHSGLAAACSTLEKALVALQSEPRHFQFFRITGAAGSGKSHVLSIFRNRARALGFDQQDAVWFDESEWCDDTVRGFIAAYERLKADGGLLVVAANVETSNPHVSSRLAYAIPLALSFPTDEELLPLLRALSERRGIRLNDSDLAYLVKRLPANPLSLSALLAKIDDLSLSVGKQASRSIFREVFGSAGSKDGAAGKP